jgi:hypothetical protein
MRKIILEALEYIVGIVVIGVTMGWIAWSASALLTADVPDVKMKTHDRPLR